MDEVRGGASRRVRPGHGAWPLQAMLLLGLLLGGCRSTRPTEPVLPPEPFPATYTVVSDSLPADPEMEALVAPYRARLQAQVAEVIGEAAVTLTKAEPEGLLGNMAADAMLHVVRRYVDESVHMALTNNGGLRVPLSEGPVTVGQIYELMPFENTLVVLTLSGTQVDSLAQQIARAGGEPIAGFRFKVREGASRAVDVEVQGAPLDPAGRYRLVTSNYLAEGGGDMPVLWEALAREPLPVLLRDVLIEYVREQKVLHPRLEGRIERLPSAP